MEQLREITQMKMEELKTALHESQLSERKAMLADRKTKIIPDHHGNRAQRRAAKAQVRKREFA